jgi:hypothetical protein
MHASFPGKERKKTRPEIFLHLSDVIKTHPENSGNSSRLLKRIYGEVIDKRLRDLRAKLIVRRSRSALCELSLG